MKLVFLFLFVLCLSLSALVLFRFVWKTPSKIRHAFSRLSLTCLTLIWIGLVLEGYFTCFVTISDGFGQTLSSQKWYGKYWNPINSFGYRDIEHDVHNPTNKKLRLFVVGDSFVTGYGTNDARDRFSDVLAEQLRDDWEVFNIAKNGWNTNQELAAIRDFAIHPNTIVLSYYINDIEGAAQKVWQQPRLTNITQPHWLIRPVIEHSHFVNFAYWRLWRFQNANQMGTEYSAYLKKAYNDDQVWAEHEREIQGFIHHAREHEIQLVVVVFPNLSDMAGSKPFTDKVVRLLRESDIPVVDLSKRLTGRSSHDLVVNNLDAHPSVQLHSEVASLLRPHIVNLLVRSKTIDSPQ